jgi:hypothetical protein
VRHFYIAALPLLAGVLGSCSHLDGLDDAPELEGATPDPTTLTRDGGDGGSAGDGATTGDVNHAGDAGMGGVDAAYGGTDASYGGGYDSGYRSGYDAGYYGAGDAGSVARFTYPYDGVVYDTDQRLFWQRTVVAQKPGCTAGTYTASGHNACTWLEASTYCSNLILAGFSSWRLPSLSELRKLQDGTTISPTINVIAFPNTPGVGYWTGTLYSSGSYYWVSFSSGSYAWDPGSQGYHVRCVMG